ncbi:hypothetical protein [Microbacterium maritypicum]|uniref:Uncharacterized protein n=1 Tax=Microbacterium maritypicum TaxID=33918 RepID=A0ACD4B3T2_MICMQ|nr:hypothetical protein [Microbacterium liquefaciens]UTT52313.1 hypothetical protein NMQ05_14700 [Microbacterium liquefaciens]
MTQKAMRDADVTRDSERYSLTYRDPTGEAAVRNLMGKSAQVTWDDGFIIHLTAEDLKPLLAQLNFRMSRKGHIWGHKKNAPTGQGEGEVTSKGIEQ